MHRLGQAVPHYFQSKFQPKNDVDMDHEEPTTLMAAFKRSLETFEMINLTRSSDGQGLPTKAKKNYGQAVV